MLGVAVPAGAVHAQCCSGMAAGDAESVQQYELWDQATHSRSGLLPVTQLSWVAFCLYPTPLHKDHNKHRASHTVKGEAQSRQLQQVV